MDRPAGIGIVGRITADKKGSVRGFAEYIVKGVTEAEIASYANYIALDHPATVFGKGLESLGLFEGRPIDVLGFERILRGQHPLTGAPLPGNIAPPTTVFGKRKNPKVVAFDLVLMPPKEVSIAYALGDEAIQKLLYEVMVEARDRTLEYADAYDSKARRGKGGVISKSSSGLIGGSTFHEATRPEDGKAAPGIHWHCSIANLVELDGKFSALDGRDLFADQGVLSAIFGQIVKERTEELLGWNWVYDKKGVPRVAGVDEEFRKQCSPRMYRILESAMAAGADITKRDNMLWHQRSTKKGKDLCTGGKESFKWMEEELGVDWEMFQGGALEASARINALAERAKADHLWLESEFEAEPSDPSAKGSWRYRAAMALADRDLETPSRGHRRLNDEEWDRLKKALAFDLRGPEEIADDKALATLTRLGRERSTWRINDLRAALCTAGFPKDEAIMRAQALVNSSDVVRIWGFEDNPERQLRIDRDHQGYFETRELFEQEERIYNFVLDGIGKSKRRCNDEQFTDVISQLRDRGRIIEDDGEQYQMLYAMLCGTNRVTAVTGLAGSGKSTGVEAFYLALEAGYLAEEAGYLGPKSPAGVDGALHLKVVGAALATTAARNLEATSGIPAFSTAMLLTRLDAGTIVLEPRAIVIVDEASQAATDDMDRLREYLERVNGDLFEIGDPRQYQAVMAGGMYSTICGAPELSRAVVRLHETWRQVDLEERAMLAYFHDAQGQSPDGELILSQASKEALLRQGVSEEFIGSGKTTRDLARWYFDKGRVRTYETVEEQEQAEAVIYCDAFDEAERTGNDITRAELLMARSDQKIKRLDAAIIAEFIKRGRLDPNESVDFGGKHFYKGQRILFRQVDWGLDILNGEPATLIDVERVVVDYEIELRAGSPHAKTRTVTNEAFLKDLVYENFDATQVTKERLSAQADLERWTKHEATTSARLADAQTRVTHARERVARVKAQLSKARTEGSRESYRASLAAAEASLAKAKAERSASRKLLAEREDKLAAAQTWVEWAGGLPDDGGNVPFSVTKVTPGNIEERMIVVKDEGEVVPLPPKYVHDFIDSAYVLTGMRAQGLTSGTGVAAEGARYSDMARGRIANYGSQVVPRDRDEEARQMTSRREGAAVVNDWAANHFEDGEQNEFFTQEADRLAESGETRAVPVAGQMSLRMELGDDTFTQNTAQRVARANILGERVVAVTKTRARAIELSNAAVLATSALGNGTRPVAQIDDRLWVKNMPVIIAAGSGLGKPSIKGLIHGETYYLAAAQSHGVSVDIGDGKKVSLSAAEVSEYLDSGLATTAARQRIGTDATALIVDGHGLEAADLEAFEEKNIPTEIIVVDPELEVEHDYENRAFDQFHEGIKDDIRVDPKSHSAMYVRGYLQHTYGPDAGLNSLQAEMQAISDEVNEVQSLDPRALARRDLDRAIFSTEAQKKAEQARITELWGDKVEDLSAVERFINPGLYDSDPDSEVITPPKEIDEETRIEIRDALRGLRQLDSERRGLARRYEIVTDAKLPAWDPGVEAEIQKSQAFHADAMDRKVEIEEMLEHYVDMHVFDAMKAPKPYHETLGLVFDENNPDYQRSRALVTLVEEYRAKWAISDRNSPLGEAPEVDEENPEEKSLQLKEYESILTKIKGHEAELNLARVHQPTK